MLQIKTLNRVFNSFCLFVLFVYTICSVSHLGWGLESHARACFRNSHSGGKRVHFTKLCAARERARRERVRACVWNKRCYAALMKEQWQISVKTGTRERCCCSAERRVLVPHTRLSISSRHTVCLLTGSRGMAFVSSRRQTPGRVWENARHAVQAL